MKTEWRTIKKFPRYEVSQLGIREIVSGKNKRLYNNGRYLFASIYQNKKNHTCKFHRALAEAFIPNPNNLPEVNHIDTNKLNNDISNLEWITHKDNLEHAMLNGLIKRKLTDTVVLQMVKEYRKSKLTRKEISDKYGISHHTFRDILRGRSRKNAF